MIIVITGPTGVGKTKLSIKLAEKLSGEIINADAMQIYKGLDIGTAKITEAEKSTIPHHLFDIKSVDEEYNIFSYQSDARTTIKDIQSRKKVPILVGGSGLYIKSALYNYQFSKENPTNYEHLSKEELLTKIKEYNIPLDFDTQNPRRLIRVLSKLENNTYDPKKTDELLYNDVYFIGLTTNRNQLYNIINQRVEEMFNNGLLDEVKSFHNQNLRPKSIMTAIGYKEVYQYLDNTITYEECLELIKKNSRRYAKRQYTFFNHQLPIKWFDVNYEDFNQTINEVLDYIKNN